MRHVGMALFGLGFLAGAFFLVQQLETVNWVAYGASLAVCVAGVLLMRVSARGDDTVHRAAEANMQVILQSLDGIVRKIGDINQRRDEIGVYGIHNELDAVLIDDLNAFVAAREALIHRHGLERYARVMDAYASGERALNRAWSASADGYIDEVHKCLDRAERSMVRARAAVDSA